MVKTINKSQRDLPQAPEEAKHKKKSKGAKETPWAKHKHKYETVLIETKYLRYNGSIRPCRHPAKICTICGRYDSMVKDSKYYIERKVVGLPFLCMEKDLSEEAYKLPVWYMDEVFDKVATQERHKEGE